jgi:hypothetical protein
MHPSAASLPGTEPPGSLYNLDLTGYCFIYIIEITLEFYSIIPSHLFLKICSPTSNAVADRDPY